MPKRKNLPIRPTPPRKSVRCAANTISSGDRTDNVRSREKILSDARLIQEVSKMARNKPQAELMVLELMRKYKFDFFRLKQLLRLHNLNVSFSKVQYVQIAPLVGLAPHGMGQDMPTFEMFTARLPNRIFPLIINDIRIFGAQYGPLVYQTNEEARSRYLSSYFNRIVALFSGRLLNKPETIMEGRITTKGRIEYQFQSYGSINIVFIEVKLNIGSSTERLNFVAQVIAECDACSWMNNQMGYDVPIMAILCDGRMFSFYKFVDKRNEKPQISLGRWPNGSSGLFVDDISMDKFGKPEMFYRRLRAVCDTLYYVFLNAYHNGMEAYWKRSVETAMAEGKPRSSTPGWYQAGFYAKNALEEAIHASELHDKGEAEESEAAANRAIQILARSITSAPLEIPKILPDPPEGVELL